MTNLNKDKKSLSSIVDRLKMKAAGGPEADYFKRKDGSAIDFSTERISQTNQAVFQTPGYASTSMGDQYVELERLKRHPSVFLGPDGRIIDPGPPPPRLAFGDSTADDDNVLYPCPVCKKMFKKSQGVLRHSMRCES